MLYSESDPEAQACVEVLREALEKLGWTVGRNLAIEYRWGMGDIRSWHRAGLCSPSATRIRDLCRRWLAWSRVAPRVKARVPVGRGEREPKLMLSLRYPSPVSVP
jgi:hypothetical protein